MLIRQQITFDKAARWAILGLIILATFFIVKSLSSVLLPFAIAWLLAYLLYPIVKFVQYKLHVPTRALSIIVSFIFVLAIITGVFWLIVPPFIEQVDKLISFINKYIKQSDDANQIAAYIQDWLQQNHREIERFFQSEEFMKTMKSAMPQVFNIVGQTARVVISIVASFITLLYMFFILLDYEYLTNSWIKIFPKHNRPFWQELAVDVERELNNYIRGQGLVALCMGIMFCIGFTIIDFPMAIGLGILIGILDLVPYLHTFALIPTAFLALMKAADTGQNFWVIFGLAVLIFIIVQVITDMVVTPKIMGKAMGLNPAILLLSLHLGSPARFHRTHHRPAPHYTHHRLLATIRHEGTRKRQASETHRDRKKLYKRPKCTRKSTRNTQKPTRKP